MTVVLAVWSGFGWTDRVWCLDWESLWVAWVLECIADALMPSMSCCPLRHHGTGVCGSQGMGCCGGGLGSVRR